MSGNVEPSRNPSLVITPPRDGPERRRFGRVRMEAVTCSLGEVLDLSRVGAKVLRRGRRAADIGDTFTVTLKYGQFALPVDVRVARLEKVGFRRYLFGLEFQEVNERIREKLGQLARIASEQRTFASLD